MIQYKSMLLSLLIINSVMTTKIIIKSVQDIPRLPIYIGIGYDALHGNPESDRVDPGFSSKIFDFKYQDNRTTQDGRYSIPDHVNIFTIPNCMSNTRSFLFRGTQNYQQQLRKQTQFYGDYNGSFVKSAFTQSSTYNRIQSSTVSQNNTISNTISDCSAYVISLFPLSRTIDLTTNFLIGVEASYVSNSWDLFIKTFGSHFVEYAEMGGIIIQQMEFTRNNEALLESVGVDLNVTNKAYFGKYYDDPYIDWDKYRTQIQYIDHLKSNIRNTFIGGKPPEDDKIKSWRESVVNNPIPFTVRVRPISDLFQRIENPKVDNIKAEKQFLAFLDSYCQTHSCKIPKTDKPKPQSATSQQTKTIQHGGHQTEYTTYDSKFSSTTFDVKKVVVYSSEDQIHNLQLVVGDHVKQNTTAKAGGIGGKQSVWQVPSGQKIQQIDITSNNQYILGLQFTTNKGTKSPQYGSRAGSLHQINVLNQSRIIGFYGKMGKYLDSLGLYVSKTQNNIHLVKNLVNIAQQ